MADRPRNKLADLLTYLSIRTVGMCLQMLPIDAALAVGRRLGDMTYIVCPRWPRRALDNLRLIYGSNASDRWIRRTARDSMRHLGMLIVEVLYAPRLIKINTAFRYIRLKNMAETLHLLLQNRPVIMLSGHYGNWELLNAVLAVMGFTSYTVARHLPNPYMHRYIFGMREKSGQRIITKKGATATVTEVLDAGQIVCFLADQNAGTRGLFVDFFGRPASTFRSIALLARAYDAPVIVTAATRLGPAFKYEISVEEIIYPQQWHHRDDAVLWITATYTKAIERVARRHLDQYLWVHRRWKSQPQSNKKIN